MNELDALLQPFALWLGLGLIKAGIVVLGVWLAIIVWRGTTDGEGYDL
jgi:hypothetical protein